MEPTKKEPVLVSDLNIAISATDRWSQESFQCLIESGFLHDIVESIKSPGFNEAGNKSNFNMCMMGITGILAYFGKHYEGKGGITLGQLNKALELVSSSGRAIWFSFLEAIHQLSFSSVWWIENKLTWETRDEWRKRMELKPLNPVLENEAGLKIVFKSAGHCNVWKNPPEGYRYASHQEIVTVNYYVGREVLTSIDGRWFIFFI